jgi:hypothetical protein
MDVHPILPTRASAGKAPTPKANKKTSQPKANKKTSSCILVGFWQGRLIDNGFQKVAGGARGSRFVLSSLRSYCK